MSENTSRIWSAEARAKLTRLVDEGCRTMHEIESLRDGLNDTIKSIGDELEIKPAILKKVIRIAHKASAHEENRTHEDVNTILELTGKNF